MIVLIALAVLLAAVAVGAIAVVGRSTGALALAPHQATTAHLQALYPFMAEGGLGGSGIYIGRDIYGGSFCYDGFELYERKLLTSTNLVLAGAIGRAKSSLCKCYLLRQNAFGRRFAVVDPKGEYGRLAETLGVAPVRLEPGGEGRLNPLDPGPGADVLGPGEVRRRQLSLLVALASASLGRGLFPEERAACTLALETVSGHRAIPVLPDVVEALFEPAAEGAARLRTTPDELARASRDVALELHGLCAGELAGMFDGPSTVEVDWDGPGVVLDLSAVYGSDALSLLMCCATAWLRAAVARPDGGQRILVVDEAWHVLSYLVTARWLRAAFKFSRSWGLSNVLVIHRPSDLRAAGSAGSEQERLAEGLLRDAETRVIYGQPDVEVPWATQSFGLSRTEGELLPHLRRGMGLWKVGQGSYLVEHKLSSFEEDLVQTDERMIEAASRPVDARELAVPAGA